MYDAHDMYIDFGGAKRSDDSRVYSGDPWLTGQGDFPGAGANCYRASPGAGDHGHAAQKPQKKSISFSGPPGTTVPDPPGGSRSAHWRGEKQRTSCKI